MKPTTSKSAGSHHELERKRRSFVHYDLFILALCVFALLNVAVSSVPRLSPEVRSILEWADQAVCGVFFLDFAVTFWRAPDRKRYFFTWGWIDLLSSIPAVSVFRLGRLGRAWRLIRVLRVLRGARATRLLAMFILERRAQGALFSAALLSLLVVVFASIAILQLERGPGATIRTAGDALWWTVATITTSGSEHYAVSTGGRLLAALLTIYGFGLVGAIAGVLTAWFLGEQNGEDEMRLLRKEVASLRQELAAILPSLPREHAGPMTAPAFVATAPTAIAND